MQPCKQPASLAAVHFELIEAMSALNMEPKACNDPQGVFLSDTDEWVAHAMEHLVQATRYVRELEQGGGQ